MVNEHLENIKRQTNMLELISRSKVKLRKAILTNADKDLVEAICHLVFNLLKGNIHLSEKEKQKLSNYRKTLRNLVKKSSFKEKKKILVQKGGFLEYLIPAAIGGISSIISSIISSNSHQTPES